MSISAFSRDLVEKVKAGFQVFSLSTREPRRILDEFRLIGEATKRAVFSWDIVRGFQVMYPHDAETAAAIGLGADFLEKLRDNAEFRETDEPSTALDRIKAGYRSGDGQGPTMFPDKAFFLLLDTPPMFEHNPPLRTRLTLRLVEQAYSNVIEDEVTDGAQVVERKVRLVQHPIIFVHPQANLHPDVDHLVEPLHFPLMTADEVAIHGVDVVARSNGVELDQDLRRQLAGACTGLLAHQALDALSVTVLMGDRPSLVRSGVPEAAAAKQGKVGFYPCSLEVLRDYRTEIINQSGLIRVGTAETTFADVIGLDWLKTYLRALLRARPGDAKAKPKGVLLLGPPGTGKTHIAQAAGNETGRIVLEADIGNLMAGIVGETEARTRAMFDLIDAAGSAVLVIDEIEKALSGSQSSGQTDGGVTSRLMGSVLKWMNDHTSDVVLLATANDVTKLPPELLRAGRFDCICYTDLTTDQARKKLWPYYLAQYGLDPKQKIPADANWTAAEIASCARQAALLDVPAAKAAEHIVPIAELHGEMIANLREYARKHGCIDANRGGKYVEDKARAAINSSSVNVSPPAARGRRVEGGGDPSLN